MSQFGGSLEKLQLRPQRIFRHIGAVVDHIRQAHHRISMIEVASAQKKLHGFVVVPSQIHPTEIVKNGGVIRLTGVANLRWAIRPKLTYTYGTLSFN